MDSKPLVGKSPVFDAYKEKRSAAQNGMASCTMNVDEVDVDEVDEVDVDEVDEVDVDDVDEVDEVDEVDVDEDGSIDFCFSRNKKKSMSVIGYCNMASSAASIERVGGGLSNFL
jgi:hypothetical protein